MEGEEGSSQGETFEVRTMIRIKQGHHCPLHPQVKPKITRKVEVNGCFLDKLRPEVETFYCFVLWLADSYITSWL